MEKRKQKRDENKTIQRRSPIRLLYLVSALLISGYFIFQSIRSYQITIERVQILDQAREEVEVLRLQNVELVLLSEKVITEAYIESQARDRLNYAKDGELLYIIPEELMEDQSLIGYVDSLKYGYISEKSEVVDPVDEWVDLFKYGI